MCTPTTGSPTITLFQLRSNCHTLLNSQKAWVFRTDPNYEPQACITYGKFVTGATL